MSRKKQTKDKSNAEDEDSKSTARVTQPTAQTNVTAPGGPTPNETLPTQTFDEYQCSGNVETDFPTLCALLDIKIIPVVRTKYPSSSTPQTEEQHTESIESEINDARLWTKPCLKVELENADPISTRSMKISGWRVTEQIFRALQKMLPSMRHLVSLQFWQVGLTDQMVISLTNTLSLCSSLRVVTLEGNVLPEQSYHLLLSEDSILTHLSLRNNRIGDEEAHLIGSALSTARTANKNLLFLNLAFNSIGDAGAMYIAQGLRLNRALLFLSLSNNQIGDSGAAHLATVIGEFALTHEEVVERRKLLLQIMQAPLLKDDPDQSYDHLVSVASSTSLSSSSKGDNKGISKKKEASKKDEKAAGNKENLKSNKKSSDVKKPQTTAGKPGAKDKQPSAQEAELMETVNPLLDQLVQARDGQLFMPGNTTLTSLNLSGNRIAEKSLPLFLASLEKQGERGGLLRLCLQRNLFPPDCECYVKIKELLTN
ncbi:leucine-rich repeat-containing protein 71 [Pholidichthys leucotaenia]